MKITCQSCQSKYTVSDEKVQGRTVKIKCRKCGATILVNSAGGSMANGIADPESTAAGPSDGAMFLVNVGDGDQRSMSLPELVAGYQSGAITAETYVWAEGMGDWQPLGQVDAIVSALSAGGSLGAAPEPQASSPQSSGQPGPGYGPAAQPAYTAQPGYAPAGQPAPSQPYPPASVPEASGGMSRAAVRRDPARPSQDLFGKGAAPEPQRLSEDIATSAPLFSNKGGTGGRDENSTLFSLSALTANPGTSSSATSATSAAGDDSGLIDLKALSAGTNAPSPAAAIVHDDGGLFQLSAPLGATTAAPSVAPSVIPPPKNRGALYVGVGVAVAGLAITGAFFGMKGGDPPPAPAPTTEVAAAPPPAPTPTPPVEPTPAAVDPGGAASVSASASATAKGPIVNRPTGGGVKPGGVSPAGTKPGGATAPTTPTAPPSKPKGGCGCAASDLMCNMQCSAKGK